MSEELTPEESAALDRIIDRAFERAERKLAGEMALEREQAAKATATTETELQRVRRLINAPRAGGRN